MFRLHFTSGDLVRLRFAGRPAPLVELVLGLMVLQDTKAGIFDQWRQATRRAFPKTAMPLLDLVYPDSGPEYLDSLAPTFTEGLDEVLSGDPALVRLPYSQGAEHRPIVPWVRDLAEGNRDAQRILATALTAAHQAVFGHDWRRAAISHQLDLAFRRPIMSEQGIEAAVASVLPRPAWWEGSTLCVDIPSETEIQLAGDGLTLMPSAFLTYAMFGRQVPGKPLLLMYPARLPLPMITSDDGETRSLASLIGKTRAAVLEVIADRESVTTSGLGRRLGISPGRASEHATVLREAGLISSQRDGQAVLHTPTELGRSLLGGLSGHAQQA